MVIVIMRLIQRVANGKWDELEEIDKKFNEIEDGIGYPPKKRYRSLSGAYDNNVVIVEREWQSLSKMEKLMTKAFLDPEFTKLEKKLESIIEWQKTELYVPHPAFPE
jgi:hypothetical protein